MNDEELADKIVACGVDVSFISHIDTDPGSTMNEIIPDPYKLVRDWRVAGAMIEKCSCSILQNERSIWLAKAWATDESPRCEIADSASSPARAINLACVQALDGESQ